MSSPCPGFFPRTTFTFTSQDNESHFYVSLQQWRQLNLSPSFIQFANKADPLSLSMPLLLHNWRGIVELWLSAVDAADDEALRALLEYAHPRLPLVLLPYLITVYSRNWHTTFGQPYHPSMLTC